MIPSDEKQLERLLRERAPGPPTPPDSSPWEFLREDPEGAWPLVSKLLLDVDPIVRARALEFVMTWRDDRSLPRLLEVARLNADLFADQIVDGVRLRERLQHAVANRAVGKDAPSIAPILISLFDDREPSIAAAPVAGAHDPKRAAQIAARSSPAWARAATAAVALYRRDDIEEFLRTVPSFAADAEDSIVRDDERAKKIAAKVGLPGPTKPAPQKLA